VPLVPAAPLRPATLPAPAGLMAPTAAMPLPAAPELPVPEPPASVPDPLLVAHPAPSHVASATPIQTCRPSERIDMRPPLAKQWRHHQLAFAESVLAMDHRFGGRRYLAG
jgi:hypothetical protein